MPSFRAFLTSGHLDIVDIWINHDTSTGARPFRDLSLGVFTRYGDFLTILSMTCLFNKLRYGTVGTRVDVYTNMYNKAVYGLMVLLYDNPEFVYCCPKLRHSMCGLT